MRFLLLFSMLSCLLLPSCGLFNKKKTMETKGPQTMLVGVVEMVNPDQNYVLIRCDQVPSLAAGTELIAMDATGVESKLKLTPERKGRYLTADIQSGQPKVANLVIHRTSDGKPLSPQSVPVPIPAPMPVTPPPPLEPVATPPIPLEPIPIVEPLPTPVPELEPAVR